MTLKLNGTALRRAVAAAAPGLDGAGRGAAACCYPHAGQRAFDVEQLFAGTCGFCHADGGRAAGRGPQLMESPRDDDFLRNRIKTGKNGAMPAFGAAFTDAQIDEIIKHIRSLKPR